MPSVRLIVVSAAALSACSGMAMARSNLYLDLGSYSAANGNSGVLVDFDSAAPGTDIGNQSINGVEFHQVGSPLLVVQGSSTFTPPDVFSNINNIANNVLTPTTGKNLLSPGGSELGSGEGLDRDSIEMVFASPVQSVGFDVAFQSLDGFSFLALTAYDADGNVLYDNGLLPAGSSFDGNAGGVQFYGLISDGAPIARIALGEFDDDQVNPDANIGIDTIRGGDVPAPAPAAVLGLAGMARLRRRR